MATILHPLASGHGGGDSRDVCLVVCVPLRAAGLPVEPKRLILNFRGVRRPEKGPKRLWINKSKNAQSFTCFGISEISVATRRQAIQAASPSRFRLILKSGVVRDPEKKGQNGYGSNKQKMHELRDFFEISKT